MVCCIAEMLVPISPQILAEIPVRKVGSSTEQPQLVESLDKILGLGAFLAEGELDENMRWALVSSPKKQHYKLRLRD